MALTYTIAGLQTELDAVHVATDAGSWDTARRALIRARLVLASLPENAANDGATLKLRHQLDDLSKIIDDAQAQEGRAAGRRMIRSRTAHRD